MDTNHISTTQDASANPVAGRTVLVAQGAYESLSKNRMSIRSLLNEEKENNNDAVPKIASTSNTQGYGQFVRTPRKRRGYDDGADGSSSESDSRQRRPNSPPRKRAKELREPLMLLQPFTYPIHMLSSTNAKTNSVSTPLYTSGELPDHVCPAYNSPVRISRSVQAQQYVDWTYVSESEYESERDADQRRRSPVTTRSSSHQPKSRATAPEGAQPIRSRQRSAAGPSEYGSFDGRVSSVGASDKGYDASSEWEGDSEAPPQIRNREPLISTGYGTTFANGLSLPSIRRTESPERPTRPWTRIVRGPSSDCSPWVLSPMNSEDWRRVERVGSSYQPSPLNSREFRVLEERQPVNRIYDVLTVSSVSENLGLDDHIVSNMPKPTDHTVAKLVPVICWDGPGCFVDPDTEEYSSENSACPQITQDMGWIRKWAAEVARSAEDPPPDEESNEE